MLFCCKGDSVALFVQRKGDSVSLLFIRKKASIFTSIEREGETEESITATVFLSMSRSGSIERPFSTIWRHERIVLDRFFV